MSTNVQSARPRASADFSELLLRLYRLAQEQALGHFQDEALKLVRTVVPFDSSMWGSARTSPTGIDVHTLHLFEKSPEMMVDYEPLKQYDTAAASLMAQTQSTRSFHADTRFHKPHEREYRGFLRRHGQNNIFISLEHNASTRFGHWVSLFREDGDHHATPQEEAVLAQLAPHLMQSLSINRMIFLERLDTHSQQLRGAAVADLRGVIYHADPNFRDMLAREWSGWDGHALPSPPLAQFLEGKAHYRGGTVVLKHRLEHGLLFLRSRLRCPADSLTPRELAVAQLLAKGNTYKQIAQQLQRAPATVRNQTRSIYDKLEVNHVAGLIDALQPLL